MKIYFNLVLLLSAFSSLFAQQPVCAFHHGAQGSGAYSSPQIDTGAAAREVAAICSIHGAMSVPVFKQPGINNALAFPPVLGRGGYIIYDPIFFNQTLMQHGRAATIGILAHEVGHILTGIRVPNMIPDWSDEARADYFAGFTLARMQISRRGIQSWLSVSGQPSHRHPDGFTRIHIIEQGYIAGGGTAFDF